MNELNFDAQNHELKIDQTKLLHLEGQCGGGYCRGNDLDFHSGGAQLKTCSGHWPPCLRVTVLLHILQYRFSISLNP